MRLSPASCLALEDLRVPSAFTMLFTSTKCLREFAMELTDLLLHIDEFPYSTKVFDNDPELSEIRKQE